MATIVDTYIKDGDKINVYESGAHYNATQGHLIKAPPSAMITPETSRKYKEQLAEKKREALVRGAGRALEKAQAGEWTVPNALDVVEALGEAIMIKALNPDSAKQVDAARFILQEAGIAETQTKSSDEPQQFAAGFVAAVRQLRALLAGDQAADVVDAESTDMRNALPGGTGLDAEIDISATNNKGTE